MSARDVAAVLRRYDDDAWAALASRGLLRRARKDLETLHIELASQAGGHVEVTVGDRTVRFGTAGPAEATCSCPSAVTCQHILTAGLWLASAAADDDAAGGDEPDTGRLHDELMALDAAALTGHAGLAGYRWAHQTLDDLPGPPGVRRDGYLAVTFEQPPLTVRYLGGGLDGLVADQALPQAARYRVAAVLAWQRAHGLVLPPPAAPRSRAAGPSEAALSRAQSRARLRVTVAAVLRDMVAVGVSHLSPAIGERLETAATWAQGAEYHRLALALRRLADQTGLLLARSALADDLVLLDQVAYAHALVAALDAAAAAGTEPLALTGRARTAYDPVRSLELLGLGGLPWRTGSGYHGLTCVFWSPAREQYLTWTDTRPQSLAGFDPRARWSQPAPWTGLATPADSAGRRLTLISAQVSADRRISGVESTTAAVTALSGQELAAALPAANAWQLLAPPRVRGLADADDRASRWAVLAPAGARPARWDNASQTLEYPLLDAIGQELVLEVAWSRLHAHVTGRLEALGADFPAGALVVARVARRRGRLTGEPLSLILPGRDIHPVDALHFDDGPERHPSALVEGLLKAGAPDTLLPGDEQERPAAVPLPLADLRALLEAQAQRGCAGVAPGVVHDQIARAHGRLRDAGLHVFADPDPAVSPAEALLRSLFVVQQVEQALA